MLMDMTFGFGRQNQDVLGPDFQAGNFGLDVARHSRARTTRAPAIDASRYAGYPAFDDTGFSALGNRDGWNPIFRDERTYSLATNLTKMKGRHDFRGGYLMNFFYLDHWQPETGNPRGRFDFNRRRPRRSTAASRRPTSTTSSRRSCSGYVGSAGKSVQNELMTAREWQHSLYFRDRWTPTGKLTLDLGLR